MIVRNINDDMFSADCAHFKRAQYSKTLMRYLSEPCSPQNMNKEKTSFKSEELEEGEIYIFCRDPYYLSTRKGDNVYLLGVSEKDDSKINKLIESGLTPVEALAVFDL